MLQLSVRGLRSDNQKSSRCVFVFSRFVSYQTHTKEKVLLCQGSLIWMLNLLIINIQLLESTQAVVTLEKLPLYPHI